MAARAGGRAGGGWRGWAAAVGVTLGALAGGVARAEPRFELIGRSAIPMGVSSDGRTAAGQELIEERYVPFVWDAHGGRRYVTEAQIPFHRWVYGISGDGGTIVGFRSVTESSSSRQRGYLYNHRTGVRTDVEGEASGYYVNAMLRAVSHDGGTAVGMLFGLDTQAAPQPIVWTEEGGRRRLDVGRYIFGEARGVSADGSIAVGQVFDFERTVAAVWTTLDQRLTVLPGLSGQSGSASAYAVSADGSTVVGTASQQMVMWRNGQITVLGGGTPGRAMLGNAVNADGSVICGYNNSPDGASIWTQATGLMRFSDYVRQAGIVLPEGLSIHRVTGISADGTVFSAWGDMFGDGPYGMVFTIPAPASLGVLLVSVAGVRRRR